ncbi:MAG: radical SAM family heme chaperone HemW [Gemmatimonas sp.]
MTPRHLYAHVPFCARRCSYCDFSIAVRSDVPVAEYLNALRAELSIRLRDVERPRLDTLYFGGGTPSRLGAKGLSDAISLVREYADLALGAEVTIEANPDDVTATEANTWLQTGINRVSLGIQSFDDSVLEWMHRVHDSARAVESFRMLRSAGFENISVDLIFALPESLGRSWERDLASAIDLNPEHISLYGLTIEPSTPLARWRDRNVFVPADEDRYAEEFLIADRMTAAAGFEHYEVSNFAKPGKQSRHNAAYWTGAPYIGVGPSAHSYDGLARSWNVAAYAAWVRRLADNRTPTENEEQLTGSNRAAERVYLGLRTRSGLAVSDSDRAAAERWREEGWASLENEVVRLTPEGWLRLDSLAAALTGL